MISSPSLLRSLGLGLAALLAAALSGAGCASPGAAASAGSGARGPGPAQVMTDYVEALRTGDTDRALAHLYLPTHGDHRAELKERLEAISRQLQASGVAVQVSDSRLQSRMALVIYGFGGQESPPQPVFLVRDPAGLWKLHNPLTSGPLQDAMRDRHDFLAARDLALWGARRMAEIAALRTATPSAPRVVF